MHCSGITLCGPTVYRRLSWKWLMEIISLIRNYLQHVNKYNDQYCFNSSQNCGMTVRFLPFTAGSHDPPCLSNATTRRLSQGDVQVDD